MAEPFKSYDIRGIYPKEIDENFAYKLGRAIVVALKSSKIVVGRDCRLSSPALTKSLIYGITDQGADVVDIGLTSTPVCFFEAEKNDVVMVSASHNPPEYNGFKITQKGVIKLGKETGLKKIEDIYRADEFPDVDKKGNVVEKDAVKSYVEKIRSIVKADFKPLKVLIDTGNGMGGLIVPEVLKGLPVKYEIMFKEPDGRFPNHMPNPTKPENTKDLQDKIKKGNYDLGAAYDADCDRIFFIDETGERIRADHILVLLAQFFSKRSKRVARTVSVSRIVKDKVEEMGGVTFLSKVGHANIPPVMKKNDCIVAGEVSGHFLFKDFNFAESGDLALLIILALLSETGKKISELVAPLKKYATSEEINLKVDDQDKALENIKNYFKDKIDNELDGLSIDAGPCWFNIRKSGTEPLLRFNPEAVDEEHLKECIKKVKELVKT
ncbi:phosphomannomutase/phosphoglucomutase [Candidatus Woesearchaeota archaeon]|nr:MAG: phosphomannomutase/phosphoglucomutase [Candidatus Woesearchaeota archaeon]